MRNGGAPDISVVVTVRDPSIHQLVRCLTALEEQSARQKLEILVVDDGSRDPAEVEQAVSASGTAVLLRQECLGISAGRNAGVGAALGEIVCFTDGDCEPAREWAEELARAIQAGADAAGGVTVTARDGSALDVATQLCVNFLAERSGPCAAEPAFAPGGNLAARRDVLVALPFDERWPGSEDRDWCARLLERDGRFGAAPRALVVHHLELTLARFWRRHVHYGRGAFCFRKVHSAERREAARFYRDLVQRGFSSGPRTGVAVVLAQVATAGGYLAEAVGRTWPPSRSGSARRDLPEPLLAVPED